ncbi:MAG: hypothetical protein H6730_24605 [Deltaproteobacteria bacterium]|nr:hypothetical protein [Deltaproteobacteria bacterium]
MMLATAAGLLLVAAAPADGPVRLGWLPVDEISIDALEQDSLRTASPAARCALRAAHELAELSVGYRYYGDLGAEDLARVPFALSCSELVYYAYASCGVALGPLHQRTRAMAFQPGIYAPAMARLAPDTPLLPGDLLVYHRDQESVEREVAARGWARPGHVVMVVAPERFLIIGAHGSESTPADAPTGVGYRVLPERFDAWTSGRHLVAVYRPVPPELQVDLPVTETASTAVVAPLDNAP